MSAHPPELQSELNQKRLAALVIWSALTGSMFLYAIMCWGLPSSKPGTASPDAPPPPAFDPRLWTMFATLGGGLVLTSLVLRKILLKPSRLFSGAESTAGQEGVDQTLLKVSERWLTAHIISWGFNEALVISGFVPAFLGRNPMYMLPFLMVGFGLNLVMKPNFWKLRQDLASYLAHH